MGNNIVKRITKYQAGLSSYYSKLHPDELSCLLTLYEAMSERCNGHGIDKQTFLQFIPLPGLWGERLFERFSFKQRNYIDFEEFVVGVSVCCRGTKADKIHVLFQLFDLDEDGFVQPTELRTMLENLPSVEKFLKIANKNLVKPRDKEEDEISITGSDKDMDQLLLSTQSRDSELPPEYELNYTSGDRKGLCEVCSDSNRDSFFECKCNEGIVDESDMNNTSPLGAIQGTNHSSKNISNQNGFSRSNIEADKNDPINRKYDDSIKDTNNQNDETTNKVDIESFVDSIMAECDFDQAGHLNSVKFKQFLMNNLPLLQMFTDCLHEEAWDLRGHALYRSGTRIEKSQTCKNSSNPLKNPREEDSSNVCQDNHANTKHKLSQGEFYKIRRLFTKKKAMIYESSADIEGTEIYVKLEEKGEKAKDLPANPQQPYPSLDVMQFILNSQEYVDTEKIAETIESNGNRLITEKDTYSCPICDAPMLLCSICGSPYPKLKLVDGSIRLECRKCINERPSYMDFCWRCKTPFSSALSLLGPSEPTKDGILWKCGNYFHKWKSGYFVLIDNLLYNYCNRKDTKPIGCIFLEGCYVEIIDDHIHASQSKYGFTICYRGECNTQRTLFAASIDERREWLEALRSAMKIQAIHQIYDFIVKLGEGKFSTVYKAVHKLSNVEYAIKVVHKAKASQYEREMLRCEMAILRLLRHPHVICLKEIVDTSEILYIVMELARGGELYDLVVKNKRLSEPHVHKIISQLLEVIDYLHKCGIVHRDLKPENILLSVTNTDAEIKLTDFGLSTLCSTNEVLKQPCGTLAYVAPEILTLNGYDSKVDIWSVGVIMYLLLSGSLPFVLKSKKNIDKMFSSESIQFDQPIWKRVSSAAKDLLTHLLDNNPKTRPSASTALQHIWIKNPVAVIDEVLQNTGEELATIPNHSTDYIGLESTFTIPNKPPRAIHHFECPHKTLGNPYTSIIPCNEKLAICESKLFSQKNHRSKLAFVSEQVEVGDTRAEFLDKPNLSEKSNSNHSIMGKTLNGSTITDKSENEESIMPYQHPH